MDHCWLGKCLWAYGYARAGAHCINKSSQTDEECHMKLVDIVVELSQRQEGQRVSPRCYTKGLQRVIHSTNTRPGQAFQHLKRGAICIQSSRTTSSNIPFGALQNKAAATC